MIATVSANIHPFHARQSNKLNRLVELIPITVGLIFFRYSGYPFYLLIVASRKQRWISAPVC